MTTVETITKHARKPFYTERFDLIDELETNYDRIKKEFSNVIIDDLDSKCKEEFLYNEGWNVFSLRYMGTDMKDSHAVCPFISSLIKKYDGLIVTAGFSILNPGTIIYPHEGYSDQLLRCHLGIDVPKGDCFLMVDGIERHWKEGEAFIFDDTFEHQTWNTTEQKRIILLLDLDKDMLLG